MKNIKKCFNYTLFLCVFLAVGCASTITQIPKNERTNSGLNIAATLVNENDPFGPNKTAVDYLRVKVINDGDCKVRTDVICERGGREKKVTVVVNPYTIREVYFGFERNDFVSEINCRLENVDFLDWYPLM